MLENSYFGTLVTALEIKFNTHIAFFRPLGDVLEVNDEYLDVLSVSEVATILANLEMNQALFHGECWQGKVASVWNLALDYAINDLLVQNSFMLPPMANYASRFEMLYAEEIYGILLAE